MTQFPCFKAYGIRSQFGPELNEDIAYWVGCAYAQPLNAKKVVIGDHMHLSGEPFKQVPANGLMDAGCDVIDLGLTCTEEVYFNAFHLYVDGGIEVSPSHNSVDFPAVAQRGLGTRQTCLDAYIDHFLGCIKVAQLKPLKLVVNAGSGVVGHIIGALKQRFQALLDHYAEQSPKLETIDGINLEFTQWRMSLRSSNTEPLLRLNIEARADSVLVAEQVRKIETVIRDVSEAAQARAQ